MPTAFQADQSPPQLLTRHEIRLRGPFDVRPYALLTDSAESFFEHLVALRQSALFFHPRFMGGRHDRAAESLLSYRRDAVATILTNFYILAGALRQRVPVPVGSPPPFPNLVSKTQEPSLTPTHTEVST